MSCHVCEDGAVMLLEHAAMRDDRDTPARMRGNDRFHRMHDAVIKHAL